MPALCADERVLAYVTVNIKYMSKGVLHKCTCIAHFAVFYSNWIYVDCI